MAQSLARKAAATRKRTRAPSVRNPHVERTPSPGFGRDAACVLAIDSAKKMPAWCVGEGGEIKAAGFDENPGMWDVTGPFDRPDLAVYEHLRAYKDDPRPQDPIDTTAGGALTAGAARARRVVKLHPDEWTGSSTKPARHLRIWHALTPREREIVAAAGNMVLRRVEAHINEAIDALAIGKKPSYSHPIHNILDAVGIYLFTVGRIGKAGREIHTRSRARRSRRY